MARKEQKHLKRRVHSEVRDSWTGDRGRERKGRSGVAMTEERRAFEVKERGNRVSAEAGAGRAGRLWRAVEELGEEKKEFQ